MSQPLTFLCVSFYFKGSAFLEACKAAGNKVFLLTHKKLEDKPWPRASIDDIFYLEDDSNSPTNMEHMIEGTAWLLRQNKIDRIIALDDFDVEKAALLRETFRVPGMGQTTARYFRDKLAMRTKAKEEGIPVPAFSSLFSDSDIHEFVSTIEAPWLVKPRSEASATGIQKVNSAEELWKVVKELGPKRHEYLVEQFKPGDVFHLDALTVGGENVFCRVSQYLNTPFEVAHGGGVFRSSVCEFGGEDDQALQLLNKKVMKAFGMQYSASHTEFIKSKETGQYYFLETASRVGGAHLAEMVEYSSGISLWAEWAKIEDAMAKGTSYKLPPVRNDYAGIIVSLSRFEHPDHSGFSEEEIVWRLDKPYHIGLIIQSASKARIHELLDSYVERIFRDFHASAPVPDKPMD